MPRATQSGITRFDMTLRRRMAIHTAALIIAPLLIGAASLRGLLGLREDFGIALQGNVELRRVYEYAAHIATARALLNARVPDQQLAHDEIRRAAATLQLSDEGAPKAADARAALTLRVTESLREIARDLDATLLRPPMESEPRDEADHLVRALVKIRDLASSIRTTIQQKQEAAEFRHRQTAVVLGVLCVGGVLMAVIAGLLQYRAATRPLSRLRDGVRSLAEGRLNERLETTRGATPFRDVEFAALAADFNSMATQLDALYHDLESQVAIKSRELIRSERLASVGQLAAGVAHEINNPLSIITGNAELALRNLHAGASPDGAAEAMQIICEEAYRCKKITEQLLTLARPSDEPRGRVALLQIARDVARMVAAMTPGRKDCLRIQTNSSAGRNALAATDSASGEKDSEVIGSAPELKQIVLNLLLNALEAIDLKSGTIEMDVHADAAGRVCLCVADNGKGMDAETRQQVFDPFFTAKRGQHRPGAGLGLSISHAIAAAHGGELLASSDGPDKGSVFTLRLPAAPSATAS